MCIYIYKTWIGSEGWVIIIQRNLGLAGLGLGKNTCNRGLNGLRGYKKGATLMV